jgi:predicted nucleotide-binding protein (sugar kinase/HSP70/actin superfamily)
MNEQFTSDPDLDAELARYAEEEAKRLGLSDTVSHWTDKVASRFTKTERPTTTLLVSGLTMAHDTFVVSALSGIGYKVQAMDVADTAALQMGKEYGNRGQCNPTYFTVGNLVKHLVQLRDEKGLSTEEIIRDYVFLTAGACGPCRFGTYVTEYRKALRDSGFDGFRVMLFQQQGGLKQATGDEVGLELNPTFFLALLKGLFTGDILNLLAYRIRPYEVEPGSTDAAIARAKTIVCDALEQRTNIVVALHKMGAELKAVKVDRLQPKPKVSIIGEFWAMTTEGDGNYHLQRFLEQEGAEVDIQPLIAWILFMIWENRHDTKIRMTLRADDGGKKGLEGKEPWKKIAQLAVAEVAVRGVFKSMSLVAGLHDYHLSNMDEIASLAKDHYDNAVRGGEGHMEVGKVIQMVTKKKVHMVVSVKPFGCMPSSGVSDGVQSLITQRYPELIFLPIETSGDGAVNVQSRVQMMLFRARQRAKEEFNKTLEKKGMSLDAARAKAEKSGWQNPLRHPKHVEIGTGVNILHAMG